MTTITDTSVRKQLGIQSTDHYSKKFPSNTELHLIAAKAWKDGGITEHQLKLISTVLTGPQLFTCNDLGAAMGYADSQRSIAMAHLASACKALFPYTEIDLQQFTEFSIQRLSIWGSDDSPWYPYILISNSMLNRECEHVFVRWE